MIRVRIRVRVKNTAGGGGLVWLVWFDLVWNDDVCIRRARSAADSNILVSAGYTGVRGLRIQTIVHYMYRHIYIFGVGATCLVQKSRLLA